MIKTFPDVPGWTFDVDEASASIYQVVGRDASGHIINLTGPDPYSLLERARVKAKELIWKSSGGSMDLDEFETR